MTGRVAAVAAGSPYSGMDAAWREKRPKVREDLVFRQLDDEWVVFDPIDNEMHLLNLSASLVWTHCTGELTGADIAREVTEAFGDGVAFDRVAADVARVLEELADKGLLQ